MKIRRKFAFQEFVSRVRISVHVCIRVYTLKAFCKPIPKFHVKRDAKEGGRAWWGVDFRLGDLHGTRISDYMSRIIESRRGNARIIGSPDNRCSNSRCLDN